MTLKLGLLSALRFSLMDEGWAHFFLNQRWSQIPAVSLGKTWLILPLGKVLSVG